MEPLEGVDALSALKNSGDFSNVAHPLLSPATWRSWDLVILRGTSFWNRENFRVGPFSRKILERKSAPKRTTLRATAGTRENFLIFEVVLAEEAFAVIEE